MTIKQLAQDVIHEDEKLVRKVLYASGIKLSRGPKGTDFTDEMIDFIKDRIKILKEEEEEMNKMIDADNGDSNPESAEIIEDFEREEDEDEDEDENFIGGALEIDDFDDDFDNVFDEDYDYELGGEEEMHRPGEFDFGDDYEDEFEEENLEDEDFDGLDDDHEDDCDDYSEDYDE